jgi:hypothetical protein
MSSIEQQANSQGVDENSLYPQEDTSTRTLTPAQREEFLRMRREMLEKEKDEVPMTPECPMFEKADDYEDVSPFATIHPVERSVSRVPERTPSVVPKRSDTSGGVMFDPTSTRRPNPLIQSCYPARTQSKDPERKGD